MSDSTIQEVLRRIPSVDVLLQTDEIREAMGRNPRVIILEGIRHVLENLRKHLIERAENAHAVSLELSHIVELILDRIDVISDYTLQPVVNATGIVIHTNLGRSILAEEAVERLKSLSRTYSNLEYDLEQGRRGSRYVHAESILCELTGSEAALVVNNNAAAVLLVLGTLAKGKEVVVSRGQLVEIGGSFRIPDVMRSSGAILKDIGCTNRTHLADYESAITEQTALLMKVHTSNYRVVGFTSEVSLQDLVELGKKHGIPVMEDLGSGSFVNFSRFGLHGEPTVQEALRAAPDILTFSGDKLLGGPQAGIIVGKEELIDRCKKNPLTRALRVDKMTLGALEATLRLYRDEREALEKIPTLRMITAPPSVLEERAQRLAALIRDADIGKKFEISVQPGFSQVGGGSLPAHDLNTYVVSVNSSAMSTQRIESAMRAGKPPVIGRIESDRYLLDVRTIQPEEFDIINEAFKKL
ncbi:MAG: L-seryl-tRNA(Sec) selenium transferase [Syntrophobacteraceae bacterium]